MLSLVGSYNFRDLGGYRTADGRATQWGQLFRSDTLSELTGADLQLLRDLGLTTVIDLRTSVEVQRTGSRLTDAASVRYLHASMLESGSDTSSPIMQESLPERYLWFLDVGRRALVDALTVIGDESSRPLVFHGTAGKDRTGVLAALVLDILGVERKFIVEDFTFTARRMELILARIRRNSDDAKWIDEIPEFLLRAEAATMEAFLNLLDEHHGGARRWALAAGVAEESLSGMSSLLVDPEV
jgi:protein-tyrosine phosphatase